MEGRRGQGGQTRGIETLCYQRPARLPKHYHTDSGIADITGKRLWTSFIWSPEKWEGLGPEYLLRFSAKIWCVFPVWEALNDSPRQWTVTNVVRFFSRFFKPSFLPAVPVILSPCSKFQSISGLNWFLVFLIERSLPANLRYGYYVDLSGGAVVL